MELCSSQHWQWRDCANETSDADRRYWVVGAIHRIIQGCYGDNDRVISVLELKLELEASGWWTGLLGNAIAKAEQSIVMNGKQWQQKAWLLYELGGFEVVP